VLRHITKLGCVLLAFAAPVKALENPVPEGVNVIELLPGWRTASGNQMAALHISLKHGWKTYWRAPGGIGIPPTFNWDGSSNMASAKIHWPAPKIYTKDGISTIGYKGEFILPIEFQPITAGQPIAIKSMIEFGVCSDVCMPVTARIQANLMADGSANRTIINKALAAQPRSAEVGGVQAVYCTIKSNKDGLNITANILFDTNAPLIKLAVIEYPQPNTWIEQTDLQTTGKSIKAKAELISYTDVPLIVVQDKLRLTLIGDTGAIDLRGCPAPK